MLAFELLIVTIVTNPLSSLLTFRHWPAADVDLWRISFDASWWLTFTCCSCKLISDTMPTFASLLWLIKICRLLLPPLVSPHLSSCWLICVVVEDVNWIIGLLWLFWLLVASWEDGNWLLWLLMVATPWRTPLLLLPNMLALPFGLVMTEFRWDLLGEMRIIEVGW